MANPSQEITVSNNESAKGSYSAGSNVDAEGDKFNVHTLAPDKADKEKVDGSGLDAKREYNRLNAARNRQRQKEHVADLRKQLDHSTRRMDEYVRENEILKAQLLVMQAKNLRLMSQVLVSVPQSSSISRYPSMQRLILQPKNTQAVGNVQQVINDLPLDIQLQLLVTLGMLH